jgi:hypothetical protein
MQLNGVYQLEGYWWQFIAGKNINVTQEKN